MADPHCEDDLALFDDTASGDAPRSDPHVDEPGSRADELLEDAKELLRRRRAESTRKTYAESWKDFTDFCQEIGRPPLPATVETVAMYISDRYGKHAPSTIQIRLAAVQFVHDHFGKWSPTRSRKIEELMESVRRNSAHVPKQAAPLLTSHVKQIVDQFRQRQDTGEGAETNRQKGNRLRALRNEAVVLFGFAGALRRSEIVAMRVEHLTPRPEGLILSIPKSKTDQKGEGQTVAIRRLEESEYCPVQSLQRWQSAASITKGHIFRGVHWKGAILEGGITCRTVNNIVENGVKAADLPNPGRFSSHSLRAGHITQATQSGIPDSMIKAQSRHKNHRTFQEYVRPQNLLDNSSSGHLDL